MDKVKQSFVNTIKSDEIDGFTIIGYDQHKKPIYKANYRRSTDI
jgi:hypothetical protein